MSKIYNKELKYMQDTISGDYNADVVEDMAYKVSRETLIKTYCDYEKLKAKTEFFDAYRIIIRANTWFSFLTSYLTACLCLSVLDKNISIFGMMWRSLIPAAIACFFMACIKTFVFSEYAYSKGKDVPFVFFIVLLFLIPIAVYLVF